MFAPSRRRSAPVVERPGTRRAANNADGGRRGADLAPDGAAGPAAKGLDAGGAGRRAGRRRQRGGGGARAAIAGQRARPPTGASGAARPARPVVRSSGAVGDHAGNACAPAVPAQTTQSPAIVPCRLSVGAVGAASTTRPSGATRTQRSSPPAHSATAPPTGGVRRWAWASAGKAACATSASSASPRANRDRGIGSTSGNVERVGSLSARPPARP